MSLQLVPTTLLPVCKGIGFKLKMAALASKACRKLSTIRVIRITRFSKNPCCRRTCFRGLTVTTAIAVITRILSNVITAISIRTHPCGGRDSSSNMATMASTSFQHFTCRCRARHCCQHGALNRLIAAAGKIVSLFQQLDTKASAISAQKWHLKRNNNQGLQVRCRLRLFRYAFAVCPPYVLNHLRNTAPGSG